jgi:hypothetical protein
MMARLEANHEKMDAKIDSSQEKMEARIDSNNEKFEVLRGSFISWMDIHQARTVSAQEEMEARMGIHQEKMEATVHSTWSESKETIKHRMEDVLSCVDQKKQGLCNQLTEKIDETQVDLQAVKTSISTWTGSLKGDITDTRIFTRP